MKCLRPRPEPQEKECPKCGNEMAWITFEDDDDTRRYFECPSCGHKQWVRK